MTTQYKTISICVTQGEYDNIKLAAATLGLSVSMWGVGAIVRAISKRNLLQTAADCIEIAKRLTDAKQRQSRISVRMTIPDAAEMQKQARNLDRVPHNLLQAILISASERVIDETPQETLSIFADARARMVEAKANQEISTTVLALPNALSTRPDDATLSKTILKMADALLDSTFASGLRDVSQEEFAELTVNRIRFRKGMTQSLAHGRALHDHPLEDGSTKVALAIYPDRPVWHRLSAALSLPLADVQLACALRACTTGKAAPRAPEPRQTPIKAPEPAQVQTFHAPEVQTAPRETVVTHGSAHVTQPIEGLAPPTMEEIAAILRDTIDQHDKLVELPERTEEQLDATEEENGPVVSVGVTYVEDIYGNKAHIAKWGGEVKARAALASLKDCVNCTDCRNCVGCRNCTQCYGCKECVGCTECRKCVGCAGCRGCTECQSCNGLNDETLRTRNLGA